MASPAGAAPESRTSVSWDRDAHAQSSSASPAAGCVVKTAAVAAPARRATSAAACAHTESRRTTSATTPGPGTSTTERTLAPRHSGVPSWHAYPTNSCAVTDAQRDTAAAAASDRSRAHCGSSARHELFRLAGASATVVAAEAPTPLRATHSAADASVSARSAPRALPHAGTTTITLMPNAGRTKPGSGVRACAAKVATAATAPASAQARIGGRFAWAQVPHPHAGRNTKGTCCARTRSDAVRPRATRRPSVAGHCSAAPGPRVRKAGSVLVPRAPPTKRTEAKAWGPLRGSLGPGCGAHEVACMLVNSVQPAHNTNASLSTRSGQRPATRPDGHAAHRGSALP